ncbi:molybdopterin cofactor-binding domain-containing protein [Actinophytocola sp.]|uniref:molybdopterin cofactor-binding domain-containing protein n=1 Tax=Actinophytocola sp. TaxID=1872138 RepID=UPI003D69FE7E
MTIGTRVRRIDWAEVTSGASRYTDDLSLPGTLVARVLRSPHPHARIRSVDVSAARRMPGVAAVVTAADFGDARYIHQGSSMSDRRPLAADRVRYLGEEVAAVAATSRAEAEAALRAIRVSYRPLPAVTDVAAAVATGAPTLHDASPDNVARRLRLAFGTPPVPYADTVSCSGRYYFARQTQLCMETNRAVARWSADEEVLELWTPTQAPYFIRKEVAHVLGLDADQIRIREVAVGGGFGSKSKICEHEALVAALAMRCPGRPVSLVYDREEEFLATKPRHDFDIELRTEATPEGRLLGHRADITADNGAYNHYGPSVLTTAAAVLASLYRSDLADIRANLVYTNKQPGGQFRGYGAPQATFAVESQMDELADRIGMDPIELRLRNVHREGETTHAGWRIVDTRLTECLEVLRTASGWTGKRADGGRGRGIGMAIAIHPSGKNAYLGSNRSEASVTIGTDGGVVVGFGGADAGTGQRSLIADVAAEELGLDSGSVDVVMMDSDRTPVDFGAWSSRGTFMSGHATRAAARNAAESLRKLAAEKFGVDPAEVTLRDGEARTEGQAVDLGSLVGMADRAHSGELRFDGEFVAEVERTDIDGAPRNASATYSFAAQSAEVEVDLETGKVRVLDFVAVHDSGVPLRPIDFESQITGGIAMGIGAALGEEIGYEGGRVVNPSYLNYATPRAADLPPIQVIPVVHHDPAGPHGAKGIGEIALNPTAAAVANAVAHAIGVRIRDLPITPDKVLAAVAETSPRRRYRWWQKPDRWWVALIRWLYPRGLHVVLHRYGTRFAHSVPPQEIARIEKPEDVQGATAALAGAEAARPLGGGTDLFPARDQGLIAPQVLVRTDSVVSMARLAETAEGDLVIGGAVRLAALGEHAATDPVLRAAVSGIASAQIREMATVGGNLCQQKRCWFYRNGFSCYKRGGATCPCYAVLGDHRYQHAVLGAHRCQAVTPSDLATVFAALDAVVTCQGPDRRRELDLAGFYRGPGETVLADDELVVEVRVPAAARQRVNGFEKLNLWEGDFAVTSAATSLAVADGVVTDARLVLGAIAPTPYRARASERALIGEALTDATIERAVEAWTADAHPLARNEWKVDATVALLRRRLRASIESHREGSADA